jgi:hypothetical protein
MVDQRKALVVTTGLTDTIYGSPYRDLNSQPLGQQAGTLHFITKLSDD